MSPLVRATLLHVRSLAGPLVLLGVVVLLVVGALAGLPRLIERTAYDDLRASVADLPGVARDLAADSSGSIPADPVGAEPLTTLRADLDAAADRLVDTGVVEAAKPGHVVRLPSAEATRAGIRRRVEMIALDDLARIRLVEGRAPRPVALPQPTAARGGPIVIESVLSRETARQMKVGVGDVVPFLAPEEGGDVSVLDPVLQAPFGDRPARIDVVGVFEAADPDDTVWDHAPSILRPFRFDDGNSPVAVTAAAVVDPGLMPGAASGTTVQTWIEIAPDALDLADPDAVIGGLRRFVADTPTLTPAPTGAPIRLTWASETAGVVEDALDRAAVTRSVLATVLSGPVGVALVVLGLGVVLLRERQRAAIALLAVRGSSRPQVAVLGLVQGLLVGAPGLLLGVLATRLLVSAPPGASGAGVAVPLLLTALPAVAVPIGLQVGLPGRVGRRRAPTPAQLRRRRRSLRLLAESAVGVLAVLSVLALLAGPTPDRVDPLVAVAPVVLGLAAALLAWRLLEVVLTVVGSAARRAGGVVAAVGSARARRTPIDGVAVLVAVALATGVAVLAVVVGATLDGAVAQAAREAAGEGLPPAVPADSPSLRGLRTALVVSVALSVTLAGLAALLASASQRRSRERTLGALAVLGVSSAQQRALALWEAAPAAVAGVLAGLLVGATALLPGALDLGGYAGLEGPAALVRPVGVVAGCAVLVLVLVVGVRAIAVALARRADLPRLFRDAAGGSA
ncbi:hypothetical protein GCM10027425_28710 [Alteromonas gracilis]